MFDTLPPIETITDPLPVSKILATMKLLEATNHYDVSGMRKALINGANPNFHAGLALRKASAHGDLTLLEILREHGGDLIAQQKSLFDSFIDNNNLKGLIYLQQTGCDIHLDDEYCLRRAALTNKRSIIRHLLKHNADIAVSHHVVFCGAAKNGHVLTMACLLKAGANPFTTENLPLRLAAREGQLGAVRYLLKKGANPKDHNHDALWMSAQFGKYDVFELLLNLVKDEFLLIASEHLLPQKNLHPRIRAILENQILKFRGEELKRNQALTVKPVLVAAQQKPSRL